MNMKVLLLFGLMIVLGAPLKVSSQEVTPEIQEEESAELSLEEYSDDFQEKFFEALKEKGIENYDKAINLFLACKQIDTDNRVVDHELAKVYLKDKQFPLAEDYALIAVNAEPENLWYLNTLVLITQEQRASLNTILSQIPAEHPQLKENLALIYYQQRNYIAAKDALNNVKKSAFTEDLKAKIDREIEKVKIRNTRVAAVTNESKSQDQNPMETFKMRIKDLIASADSDISALKPLTEEALEAYPSQPYFYYANGFALNKEKKHQEAIEILEAALDYMLDDVSLSNKIYQELSDAHKAMNNIEKSNSYLSKIKARF